MSQLLDKVNEILEEVKRGNLSTKKVLNAYELSLYTGFAIKSIYNMVSYGLIPHSKPNGQMLFFDREKIEDWLLSNPGITDAELNNQAANYLLKNKLKKSA